MFTGIGSCILNSMKYSAPSRDIGFAVGSTVATSIGLFIMRALRYQSMDYWFLNWNLLLAVMPVVFAVWLSRYLQKGRWVSWQGIVLTVLWLSFLPNSFYLASDLIHVQNSFDVTLLFDVVMLLSFTFSGFVLGYLSLYLVHQQLLKRLKRDTAHLLVAAVLLLCGLAIYLGRYLRWSTWDVIINPTGLLFDVSDRFLNPAAHEITFRTTATFFWLLVSLYITIWYFIRALRRPDKHS